MANAIDDHLDKWEQAVRRLIELTIQGQISWSELLHEFNVGGGTEIKVLPPAFVTDVQSKSIIVYEYEYRYYTDADEWRPEVDVGICFSNWEDNTLRSEWTWPATRSRHQLWSAVRYQQSGAGDFLEQFLGKSMVG